MKLIKPAVQYWDEKNYPSAIDFVAKCARVCYASESETNNIKLVDNLIDRKHLSMLRHASFYYIVNKIEHPKEFASIKGFLIQYRKCPYIDFRIDTQNIYISTNGQFHYEDGKFIAKLEAFKVDATYFFDECPYIALFRLTFMVITQISTSRELNRTSPNNIAEQSTRYVDFGSKSGITICEPWYYEHLSKFKKWCCRMFWRIEEKFYNISRKTFKWLPQDSRGFLPLDTATKCVYTYTLAEWNHILDLRYFGTTGLPHPNAKEIATQIYHKIQYLECDIWKKN